MERLLMSKNIIECDNLFKIYKEEDIEVFALAGLDLTVEEGELLAVIGSSGSGKSTFLNMIGGLDKPTTGRLFINGIDMMKLSKKQMMEYKREVAGFVWQNNARNLLPHLTAQENIELVMSFSKNRSNIKKRALELLEQVEMSHRKNNRVRELSGGEQQRIAIAIALANNPKLLLADEPTGSVDSKTSAAIFDLFRSLNKDLNLTIVIVTHDMQVAHKVERVVSISEGKISKELLARESYDIALSTMEELYSDISEGDTHEEFLVVDRHGRVQLPGQFLDKINGVRKIKAKIDKDNIILHR
jgi:ABC-type lipoprotein export system ATPase subunit